MSKAVLISIRPKWCEKIVNGEKTTEVRKTRPKLETPFKCYIYCTLQGCNEFFRVDLGRDVAKWNRGKWADRKGKVIGEFTCDRIDRLAQANDPYGIYDIDDDYVFQTCLENGALWDYGHGTPLYGWHISDLRIYDMPRDLGEFQRATDPCDSCHAEYTWECTGCKKLGGDIKRPPQSWCYVEEG
jgi:predicted transcriptional regulator